MEFYKLVATGNDFIVIDSRDKSGDFGDLSRLARSLCARRFSIGADGLIVLKKHPEVDFAWDFYNSDGSRAEMCGNGARCAARLFSYLTGKSEIEFLTDVGIIRAEVDGDTVTVDMGSYSDLKMNIEIPVDGDLLKGHFVNTGVPHFVVEVDDLEDLDVVSLGRKIRFHQLFSPSGTNVDFFKVEDGFFSMRTYERGVEDETLACGTGACAVSVVSRELGYGEKLFPIKVKGGELEVELDGSFMRLRGEARIVYKGVLF